MNIEKRAFTRGINDELIRLGLVRYQSKTAADEMADAVADNMEGAMPDMPPPEEGMAAEPVAPEVAAEVATELVESANKLVEATSGAGLAEEGAPPMPEEAELKTSAANDLDTRAHNQAYYCMVKAAQDAQKLAMGSTIEGGDKGNTLPEAAAVTGEAKLELDRREMGYAHKGVRGVGQSDHPAGQDTDASIGHEIPHPEPHPPSESPAGAIPPAAGNTVVEQSNASKEGSLRDIIQKVAMGSTIEGGDKGNDLGDASQTTGEGKIEADRRPEGYAVKGEDGVGGTDHPAGRDPSAQVGTEEGHTGTERPGATDQGAIPPDAGNTNVEQSKTSAEDPYVVLFKKTASEVAEYLPPMDDNAKVAHVRLMMGMTDPERNEYLATLHKEAGTSDDDTVAVVQKHAACASRRRHQGNPNRKDRTRANQKTAGELPPALAAAVDKKEGKDGDKKEDKGEEMSGKEVPFPPKTDEGEKKDEDAKKEGSLLDRIRDISLSMGSA